MGHYESRVKKKTHISECLKKETGESIEEQKEQKNKKKQMHQRGVEGRKSSNSAEINQVETKRTIQ